MSSSTRQRNRPSTAAPKVFDARLLLDYFDDHTDDMTIASAMSIGTRSIRRWRDQGDYLITAYRADRLATRIGLHPCVVWGNLWWSTAGEENPR